MPEAVGNPDIAQEGNEAETGADFTQRRIPPETPLIEVDANLLASPTDADTRDAGDITPSGSVPVPSPIGCMATAAALAAGVAVSAACAAGSRSSHSTEESSEKLSSLAAAAAESRVVQEAARGIGDTDKVRVMEINAALAQRPGEEQFGTRRRQQLRAALEKARQQVAATLSQTAVSTCATDDIHNDMPRGTSLEAQLLQTTPGLEHQGAAATAAFDAAAGMNQAPVMNLPDEVVEGPQAQEAILTAFQPVGPIVSSIAPACSRGEHHCGIPDVDLGCSSCGLTCHPDCCSVLCALEPCPYCTSRWLVTHENSALCMEAQMHNTGCHACGRLECWTRAEGCHARCTSFHHVCVALGSTVQCDSCDKWCHASNTDPRCPYWNRARGHVAWTPNAQQMLDTQAGTHGSVPHMSQLPWAFTNNSRTELLVDGTLYRKGYGYPGNSNRGEYNNCLIDSLRQCLRDVSCDCTRVRRDLQTEFGESAGPDRRRLVTHASYLDVESHWEAIVRSLFRHDTSGHVRTEDMTEYCVVALYGDRPGHGVVLGSLHAINRLVIINWGDVHFDPCLPL